MAEPGGSGARSAVRADARRRRVREALGVAARVRGGGGAGDGRAAPGDDARRDHRRPAQVRGDGARLWAVVGERELRHLAGRALSAGARTGAPGLSPGASARIAPLVPDPCSFGTAASLTRRRDSVRTITRAVLVGLLAAVVAVSPATAETVKIGFITSLSGPAGVIGKHMKDSVELALDHLGRKVGGLDVEIIYGDDQRKPDVGKQLADEMLKKHRVHFVSGIIWSNVMLAVAPTVTQAGTFMIGTNAGPHELAGDMGIQFVKQYVQAGLREQIPLYSVYTIDEVTLPALKEVAVGIFETRYWSPDLKNEANQKYIGDFRKKFGYTPSFYGTQSYDGILLIDSAVRAVKGDLSNRKGMIAAMRKADYKSTRGTYTYNVNHFPIQNFYLLKTVKEIGRASCRERV